MKRDKMTRREWVRNAVGAGTAGLFPFSRIRGVWAQGTTSSEAGSKPQANTQPDDTQEANPGSGRAAWMQNPKYAWGVMTHYLADWQARVNRREMSVDLWNKMVDGFDTQGMAKRLAEVGAGHYQLSIGQNSGYYLAPNPVYDQFVGIVPSRCSQRDLVADFYEALRKLDIKLMVYLPSGAPNGDKTAREALEWLDGPYANRNFQRKWEKVIAEWSRRWGNKVVGWWFDGCYYANSMYRSAERPNFASFAAAARAGNAQSAVAFNPGVIYRLISVSLEEDYTAGEIDKPDLVTVRRNANGRVDGTQLHMLSFLGEKWGMGEPRFTTDQVIAFTKKIRDVGGSVTWDVPVAMDGSIADGFLEQLAALGKAFPKAATGS
jgi:hypothetical protein